MMNAPEANIPLSEGDAQKLELGTQRLRVVQAEVLEATKQIAILETEMNQAREAKEYAENEKSTLEAEVFSLRNEKNELQESIRQGIETLRSHESRHNELTKHAASASDTLSEKSVAIESASRVVEMKSLQIEEDQKKLEEDRGQVDTAIHTLQRAIESITWHTK